MSELDKPQRKDIGGASLEPNDGLSASVDRLRRALDRYKILVGTAVLFVLGLVYMLAFKRSLEDLFEVSLPNAIAALLVFLAVFGFHRIVGVSQTEEIARLLDRQRASLQADNKVMYTNALKQVQPIRGNASRAVVGFYPVWAEMSTKEWSLIVGDATEFDVVMNWSGNFFEKNAKTFRSAIARGARFKLYLPDPGLSSNLEELDGADVTRLTALAESYKLGIDSARLQIADSAAQLVELGAAPEQVEIRLAKRLSYAAVRLDSTQLIISHYDQFPVGHPRSSAIWLDLSESKELNAYWTAQFNKFREIPTCDLSMLLGLRYGTIGLKNVHRIVRTQKELPRE